MSSKQKHTPLSWKNVKVPLGKLKPWVRNPREITKDQAGRLAVVQDRKQSDVWDFARPKSSEEHPTMTPVPLVVRCIENSSRPSNIVIDIFLGSGTSLVAAEATGRVFRGVEKDPRYVAVSLERWSMQTGQTPVLEGKNGKKSK